MKSAAQPSTSWSRRCRDWHACSMKKRELIIYDKTA
jgi:hypothetical protein